MREFLPRNQKKDLEAQLGRLAALCSRPGSEYLSKSSPTSALDSMDLVAPRPQVGRASCFLQISL